MTRKLAATAALTAGLLMIGSAGAAVAVPAVDAGFLGKGEVQTAFGWNNKALQTNAEDVAFSLRTETVYSYTCTWTTGPEHNQKEHVKEGIPSEAAVAADAAFDARKNSQITGFTLGELGEPTVDGTIPTDGGACSNGPNGTISEVEIVDVTSSLYATHGGATVLVQHATTG